MGWGVGDTDSDGWRKTRHQISSICTPLYLYFSAGAGLHLYGDAG